VDNPKTEPQVIDTVDRALAVLELFSAQRPELGITEISRELSLHKSTVFRCLASLESRGFVIKDEFSQRYALGSKVLRLATAYLSNVDVRQEARPVMERLRNRTRETVGLWMPAGERCVCIERIESTLEIRAVLNVGDMAPMYPSAPGMVVLAYRPEADLPGLLARLTGSDGAQGAPPATPVDQNELEDELGAVRENRFAAGSYGNPDIYAISAPIFNAVGEVMAALTAAGPAARFSGPAAIQHARAVRQSAAEISMAMGFGVEQPPRRVR
jgi:IclR family transcriptional regulator, KDG regulon repressor